MWYSGRMTSDELKQWREARGISQAELARRLGVAVTTLWRWEHGRRMPSAELIALALIGLDVQDGQSRHLTPAAPAAPS
jgi:transcriptional regulator with XRE-family HTH domain